MAFGQYRRFARGHLQRRRLKRGVSGESGVAKNTGIAAAGAQDSFRDAGTHELATGKETVSHELARAEGARGVRHGGDASFARRRCAVVRTKEGLSEGKLDPFVFLRARASFPRIK